MCYIASTGNDEWYQSPSNALPHVRRTTTICKRFQGQCEARMTEIIS